MVGMDVDYSGLFVCLVVLLGCLWVMFRRDDR